MESWGTNVNQKIYYTYDVDGSLISFKYNNNEYFYIRNLQGDIIKIIDINGNVLVTYSYDAFGNTLNTTDTSGISLSIINPYRYRGYRYDLETGFYYLQSRYYNPQIGRFISPDSINYLNPMSNSGENLYTYTANNPVNLIDPDGNFAISALLISVVIGIAVGLTTELVSDLIDGNGINHDFKQYFAVSIIGGLSGVMSFMGFNMVATMVAMGILDVIAGVYTGEITNIEQGIKTLVTTAIITGLIYGISRAITNKLAVSKYMKYKNLSSNNTIINKALRGSGYSLKIGPNTMDEFVSTFMKDSSFRILNQSIEASFNIALGIF